MKEELEILEEKVDEVIVETAEETTDNEQDDVRPTNPPGAGDKK